MVFGVMSDVIGDDIKKLFLDILKNLSVEDWEDYLRSCNNDCRENMMKLIESLVETPDDLKKLQKIKSKLA